MKFRYTSHIPSLRMIDGKFVTVSKNQIIESDTRPEGDFVAVDPLEKEKKLVEVKKKVAPKKSRKNYKTKEVIHASETETSSLGQ